MSYTKLSDPPAGIESALNLVLASASQVTTASRQSLLDSAGTVLLDTGETVWVACVVQDNPDTAAVEMFIAAIAAQDGAAWIKGNGSPCATSWWHGVDQATIVSLGVDCARKALMMIALGEPQPQDSEGHDVFPSIDSATTAGRSIRTAIASATELAAPLTDVL